jgi:Holliday junction resolvase-like predicted endonuclease
MNRKEKGKIGETLAKEYYLNQGYTLIEENYLIRGGEIDLLMKKDTTLVAIEVKHLDTIDEFNNYISSRKIATLEKTLSNFLRETDETQFEEIRMDAVFIKNGSIFEIYQNITNT